MAYNALSGAGTLFFGSEADKVFGKKPTVPKLPSLTEAQKTAVTANQTNFADIAKLATSTNTFNQDQLNALIDRTLGPGAREQIQQNLSSQLRGEVPEDVRNQIYRSNAERSAGTNAFGGSDSGYRKNIDARDLGLTSLQITNNALSSAEQWLQGAKAPTFDVTSMFITPAQQNAANTDQFNRNLLANKIQAAPDPGARGVFDSNMALMGMVLSAYGGGGGGYQGTYRPDQTGLTPQQAPPSGNMYINQGFGAASGGMTGGFNSPYSGGLAGASQSAGVANPYSLGGYGFGAGAAGGLGG